MARTAQQAYIQNLEQAEKTLAEMTKMVKTLKNGKIKKNPDMIDWADVGDIASLNEDFDSLSEAKRRLTGMVNRQ